MIFHYGDDEHHVTKGDCLYFDAIVPHKVVYVTETENAKILSVLFFHNTR